MMLSASEFEAIIFASVGVALSEVFFEEHPVSNKTTKMKTRLSFLNTHHIPFYIDFAGLLIFLQELQ